jgi:hypothetical protein
MSAEFILICHLLGKDFTDRSYFDPRTNRFKLTNVDYNTLFDQSTSASIDDVDNLDEALNTVTSVRNYNWFTRIMGEVLMSETPLPLSQQHLREFFLAVAYLCPEDFGFQYKEDVLSKAFIGASKPTCHTARFDWPRTFLPQVSSSCHFKRFRLIKSRLELNPVDVGMWQRRVLSR